MEYREMYLGLFNAITDALEEMEKMNFGAAKERLKQAQIDAEEAYLSQGD